MFQILYKNHKFHTTTGFLVLFIDRLGGGKGLQKSPGGELFKFLGGSLYC